jgi:hypothetical protein
MFITAEGLTVVGVVLAVAFLFQVGYVLLEIVRKFSPQSQHADQDETASSTACPGLRPCLCQRQPVERMG